MNLKKHKNIKIKGSSFRPCITEGTWFISRWEVENSNFNNKAVYIFGADGVELTTYKNKTQNSQLDKIIYNRITKHIKSNDFKPGFYRFEFDGNKFIFCEEKPNWADYDCGIWDESMLTEK